MSKTYSMAGWRIGFAVGNRTLIHALTRVKSYLDYGAFTPVQAAACAAINGPQDIVAANRALYKARRDVLVECFGRARSEEHTSELQSLMRISYAVFCLNKKTHQKTKRTQ